LGIVPKFGLGSLWAIADSGHELPKEDQIQLFPGQVLAIQMHTFIVLSGEQCGAWPLMATLLAATPLRKKLEKVISFLMDVQKER
jgi:hypothetical protein